MRSQEVLSTPRGKADHRTVMSCELISVSYVVHTKDMFSRCKNALWLLRVTAAGPGHFPASPGVNLGKFFQFSGPRFLHL